MSKNRFLKILLPSITLTFGGQVVAYTLQQAVSHTLATSPDLLIETNRREEIDKQLRASYAGYLPTLDLAAGIGQQYANNSTTRALLGYAGFSSQGVPLFSPDLGTTTKTRSEFSLIASQMVFDGLAVYHDVEGHKARVRAEAWRVNGSAQDVAETVYKAYINVLLQKELVNVARENLDEINRINVQIQKRSEGGIGRRADLDQAAGRVALANTNYLGAQANLRDAKTTFLRAVGIPTPDDLASVEQPNSFPATEDEAVELGLKYHPVLRASYEDLEVTREAHKGARAPFVPRLDLQLGMTRNHNIDGNPGDTDDNTAMLRMRWNLFSGGKDLASICETAYRIQEAQEVSNRAQREVVESVRFAWNIYETAKAEIRYLKEHVDAGIRTREAYQKQFNIGQRTLLDLLDSENELFDARTNYLEKGKYNILLGMYGVLKAMGCLTDNLGIRLPKQAEPRATGIMDGAARFFDKSETTFD